MGWVDYKQNLFLTIKRLGNPRPMCRKMQCLVGSAPWFIDDATSLIPQMGWGLAGSLSYKGIFLTMRTLWSGPNHFSKAPPPNAITLGIRISASECEDYGIHQLYERVIVSRICSLKGFSEFWVSECNIIINILKITEPVSDESDEHKEFPRNTVSLITLKLVDLMCITLSFPLFIENSNYAFF